MTQRARLSMLVVCAALVLTGTVRDHRGILQAQPARPNIVLIFPDNLGWGEVGAYGSVRGALTPRIDKLAAEGHSAQQFQRRVLLHRVARGAADRALRDSNRRDAGQRHHAVGSDDRRGAEVGRICHGALRQVAPRRRSPGRRASPRSRASTSTYGIPRTSNEAQTTHRPGPDRRAGHLVHMGGQGRGARSQRQAIQPRDTPDHRPRIGGAQRRVHGAERARAQSRSSSITR